MLYTIDNPVTWALVGLAISVAVSYLVCRFFLWKDNDNEVSE